MRRARRAFGAARRARRGIVALGLRTAAIDDARGDRRVASRRARERRDRDEMARWVGLEIARARERGARCVGVGARCDGAIDG